MSFNASSSSQPTKSVNEGLDSSDNIFSYLLTLTPDELNLLYGHTWTCKAVFRFLPDIAKQYVMRMLLCGSINSQQIAMDIPKKLTNLSGYLDSNGAKKGREQDQEAILQEVRDAHENAFSQLLKYRIISKTSNSDFTLNRYFQDTFRNLVTSVPSAQAPTTSHSSSHKRKEQEPETSISEENMDELEPKKKKRKKHKTKEIGAEFLQEYSKRKWENVLLYLVGTAAESEQTFSGNVNELLKYSQLIKKSDTVRITNEGFQFLLQETKVQVWKLLKHYLETSGQRNQVKNEILNFIFELGFLDVGKEYSSKDLTSTQKSLLVDFNDLGIIYLHRDKKKKIKDKYFFPTPLAKSLTVSMSTSYDLISSFGSHNSINNGYIIVETNYRVYAYTNSPLQIALLSLFIFPEYRLPNMVVGLITRSTIREALKNGISAHQILQFLRLNAHPQMRLKKPVIPDTVSDQILLWEKERNRVIKTTSVVYDKFTNVSELNATVDYARRQGALLWHSEEKMMMVCKREFHGLMKEFISSQYSR
ncbi:predicted protein [Naegleria gruberi]|uniref:General transcription factor IIH subunit 4 n=1 Tax=Naegleria gruberi TaxID=5762 RepID=D2VHK9_NAEGR|nr:uncharacterized protein NAEGRDRAFT_68362 [Naegleria gruberi]EFC43606.1 predicted protein [Naegleria gruberi]|eukprot:XP_002676350.1 predicted protein [Naegleria gruberi strain NEG-M]